MTLSFEKLKKKMDYLLKRVIEATKARPCSESYVRFNMHECIDQPSVVLKEPLISKHIQLILPAPITEAGCLDFFLKRAYTSEVTYRQLQI
jgi:hypothetical protein